MDVQVSYTARETAAIVKAVLLPVAYMIGNVSGSAPVKLAAELSAGTRAMQDLARSQFKGNRVIQALIGTLKDAKDLKFDNVKGMAPDQFASNLKDALDIVDAKASPGEAQAYRAFIYQVTTKVAEAQSEGFLGLGDRVSAAERKFLDNLKKLLDAAPASKAQANAAAAVAKAVAEAKARAEAVMKTAQAKAAAPQARPAPKSVLAPVKRPAPDMDEMEEARAAAAEARAAAAVRAAEEAAGQAYVVKKGDTLSAIAKQYLGKAALYPKIVEATNQKAKTDGSFATIKNPNLIYPGQKFWIPKNV